MDSTSYNLNKLNILNVSTSQTSWTDTCSSIKCKWQHGSKKITGYNDIIATLSQT